MNKLLPIFTALLLLLLNACGQLFPSSVPSLMGTAVGQTQTATMWTPTITPTIDPNESKIVEWLNETLLFANPLEATLDAKYQAVDVLFPITQVNSPTSFWVDVRCECASNTQCCIPERMFVVTIEAMKIHADKVMGQVPPSVNEIKIVCFDHTTRIGVMAASWADVKGYLQGQINGYLLGSRTHRSSLP